ncbi:MetG: methionyl-tRNA synthetase [Desulfosarcina variabilis str. Montpellier]|uniref:methionine--tRNA ligase n=1 Tax=Desulfosarcina variabilis TaxID=2300 RepID=UPI003AFAA068
MAAPFYITTPIYYVNARPHLGHAYTTIVADVVNRFQSMSREQTYFLTGTDEHGDKIVRAAKKENCTPREYVDKISGLFSSLWPEMNISNNAFIRTTDPSHIAVVESILQRIYDAGDIYFAEYEGLYCFGCERFYTERELVDGRCPDHQTPPETIKESNYFFKMSRYQQWLIDYINANPDFIRPERYKNEVLAFLREPLGDLCISRPKSRLKWGITLPFDHDYVTYVWFDALLNYVSALGYPDGELYHTFWPVAQHVVAKDILKPHGIYWPIMLKAAGLPIYQHLNVHGYWNVDQSKMSKSIGNVIEPLEMKNIYGLDAFRFFLMRDMAFGLDSNFSEEALVGRINADLANDLGNLFSRVLSMAHKYFKGVVPEPALDVEKEMDLGLAQKARNAIDAYAANMDTFAFHKALAAVWEFITHMNKYVDITAPWTLAKNKAAHKQLETVIYNLLEGLRIISGLIYPVMPDTATSMQKHLGLDGDDAFYKMDRLTIWGGLTPGIKLKKSISLFPRVELKDRQQKNQSAESESAMASPIKPEITIDDFAKVDLRVATVISAQAVPRAKKLLQLEVDLGEKRTIVSGIAGSYDPESLVGKQVIVVANLKPAKLMGVLSKGMLIAASDDSGVTVATLDKPVKAGTPLS